MKTPLRTLPIVLLAIAAGCAVSPPRNSEPAVAAASGLMPAFDKAKAGMRPTSCRASNGYTESALHARTFLWRPEWLMQIKASVGSSAGSPAFRPTLDALIVEANAALAGGPFSVVDKTHTPPTGDKHDYYSIGPYYWPNPNTPDGLPYVSRDGEVNPERSSNAFDTEALEKMSRSVATLALAYYLTNDKRYATHAAELLRVWFLDPATKMNPNLRFAQAVPGHTDGRAAGLIDTYRLVRVVEAIGLIGPAHVVSREQQAGLESWFGAFTDWMGSSEVGIGERDAANNHGIYYDAQLMSFALFARRDSVARAVAEAFTNRRIGPQVAPDGSLPQELRRTRSFHYTNYALAGAFDVASFGECFGLDLWNARAENGRTLRSAVDYISQYAGRTNEWPYPELRLDTEPYYDLLMRASWAYSSETYAAAAARYAAQYRSSLSTYLRVAPTVDVPRR